MKYYLKAVIGFRDDQFVTIPMQEAHKLYYLFNHPEERGVFNNGVALVGKNIQTIIPNWNETLGYNPNYKLTEDDWNDIRGKSIDAKMKTLIEKAKDISKIAEQNISIIKLNMYEALKLLPENKTNIEISLLASKLKV